MRIIFTILTAAVFVGSCIWAYKVRDYEPFIAVMASAAGLISLWATNKSDKPKMQQKGGRNSSNYQSGGDMTIGPNTK